MRATVPYREGGLSWWQYWGILGPTATTRTPFLGLIAPSGRSILRAYDSGCGCHETWIIHRQRFLDLLTHLGAYFPSSSTTDHSSCLPRWNHCLLLGLFLTSGMT